MTFKKLSQPWSHLIVYNWHPSHPWVLLGDTLRVTGTSEISRPRIQPYLRHIDTAFQKGTVGRIVGANVAVFAPVAGEGAVDTCQAAAGEMGQLGLGNFSLCFHHENLVCYFSLECHLRAFATAATG